MSSDKKRLHREEIARLVLSYADKEKQDDISLMFGLNLLHQMKNKKAVTKYIELFKEYLAIDNKEILYYQNISE